MDEKRNTLTEAEWQVMEELWESAPRTGRELTEALSARVGWSRSTTLTLLRRLQEKGAVRSADGGSAQQGLQGQRVHAGEQSDEEAAPS